MPRDEFDFDSNVDDPDNRPKVEPDIDKDKDKDKEKSKEKQQQQQRKAKDKPKDEDDPLGLDDDKDDKEKQKPGTEFDLILNEDEDEDDENEGNEEEEEEDDKDKDKDKDKKDDDKNDKETSNKVLRKQRDEARKELEKYKKLDPKVADAMVAFLDEKFEGKIPTPEELAGELLIMKDRETEIATLKEKIDTQNKAIRDLDIRSSPEFKEQYIDPYNEVGQNLFTEIAHYDGDGKPIAPNSTAQFHNWLLKNSKELDGPKVKQALAQFAANYKKETGGEEYSAPSVTAVMSALRELNSKRDKMNTAYDNWEKERGESISRRQQEQEKAQKDNTERAKRLRKTQAQEAMSDDIDYTELVKLGLFKDKSEYVGKFNEQFKFTEGIFQDPGSAPTYRELMVRNFKAGHYDDLMKAYKELKTWKDKHDADDPGSRGGGGDHEAKDDDEDWSDGKL
jgi:hypothetical protein